MPKISNTHPLWAPYARSLLRRLRQAEAESSFDPDIDAEGERIRPVLGGKTPSAAGLLGELEHSQHQDSRDIEDMRTAGIDGYAMDDRGSDRPKVVIAPDKILMTLRLVATFGCQERFGSALDQRACTVITGFEPIQLSGAATAIGRLFLPDGWTSQTRPPHHRDSAVLQLLRPTETGSNKITEHAIAKIEHEILAALARPYPLMILLPDTASLPANLRRVLPPALQLPPIDREIMLRLLGQTHSATGKVDRTLITPLLPENDALATMDMPSLMSALREPNAPAAARKLAALLAPMANPSSDMTLAEIGGDSPAHRAAADLVADLTAWRQGTARWRELSHALLLSGEPGTGKSVLARAIATSAGVPIVEASFGIWQSHGHLGDMLREMRRSFAEAIQRRPCVLFIDEIDAVGSRDSADRHATTYRAQVINQFLAEIDQLNRAEGVLLVGATNHPEALDPAILRPGRFDLHGVLGRPSLQQIRHMLRRALPEAGEADLQALAREVAGETPAAIDARLRAARSAARRAARCCDVAWIRASLPTRDPQTQARDHRIALHECGHAIAATRLGAAPVHRIQLSADGGATIRPHLILEGTVAEFEAEMTILLSGRAAERLVLGTVSAGAGGSEGSDLHLATRLQLQVDREAGLGVNGGAWLGPADMRRLSPEERNRVRVRLDVFERRARQLLEPQRDRLEKMADHLLHHRELNEEELKPWLADLGP
ncbi:ATP-dependent Zn protease [Rhodobacter sp. 140A]|nr:ATP-dependent Zn protease [Rhodobacter sp. 140A]